MSLKVDTRFPGGNAADIEIRDTDGIPDVRFAADPCGGTESLWFWFRLTETEPAPDRQSKVRLTWTHVETVRGGTEPAGCRPVFQPASHAWTRLKHGDKTLLPDGRIEMSWLIPHPAPMTDVALSFPYGQPDLQLTLSRSAGYWREDAIGVSQGGRRLTRLSNSPGAPGATQPGLFLIARQHAGESPGSWALDGFLQHLAQIRKAGYVVWAVPLANPDELAAGCAGPGDFDTAWSSAPRRHETRILQDDIRRWKTRCRPLLALDFRAPGASAQDGVSADVGPESDPAAAEETKWCNVLRTDLQAEFAAPEFKRSAGPAPGSFAAFVRAELAIPALRLQIPFTQAGDTLLTQKLYRELGRRLAAGVLRRHAGQ